MDPTALNAAAQGQQTGSQPTSAQSDGQSGGLNGQGKLAEDFDTFLGILVTQLQNQDPLEPMKSQEFTNQLVQFSTVEQAIATNSKLDQMLQAQAGNRASQAVNYIGKEITIDGNQVQLQNGAANFAYSLEDQAQTVAIEITDANGQVVRTLQGDTGAGRHDVSWDGTTQSGEQLSDGVYNLQIYAVDGENNTIEATTETRGEVTGFEVRDEQIHFQVGGVEVPFDQVTAVYATPPASPNP
jgi:flagellar basal-body rod modification protein FlgD